MNITANILLIEDSLSLATIYSAYLSDLPYEVTIANTLHDARSYLDAKTPDVILLDLELPDGNGLEILDQISQEERGCEIIIMTAYGSSDLAVDAIKLGAFDFLTKPFDADRLQVTVENAIKHQIMNRQIQTYATLERASYCNFIGKSLAMQAVYRTIDSLAVSTATGFIVGESGTGKELAAEAMHEKSRRSEENFIAINCGAIPKDLMESELFGHIKGAFTGATANREGAARLADGGTLFLDEICELDLDLQKKLLRFIQTGTFHQVGSNRAEQVDIRFICATNRDPLQEVKEGRFREDLYYRLHVVPVELPPLRDREDDVVLIANHFLKQYAESEQRDFEGFSNEAVELLKSYRWPGNVRELQNAVQRAVILNEGGLVTPEMLPIQASGQASPTTQAATTDVGKVVATDAANHERRDVVSTADITPLWLVEKRAIEQAIVATGNNINKAAALLEVAPSTLYRKINTWETDSDVGAA